MHSSGWQLSLHAATCSGTEARYDRRLPAFVRSRRAVRAATTSLNLQETTAQPFLACLDSGGSTGVLRQKRDLMRRSFFCVPGRGMHADAVSFRRPASCPPSTSPGATCRMHAQAFGLFIVNLLNLALIGLLFFTAQCVLLYFPGRALTSCTVSNAYHATPSLAQYYGWPSRARSSRVCQPSRTTTCSRNCRGSWTRGKRRSSTSTPPWRGSAPLRASCKSSHWCMFCLTPLQDVFFPRRPSVLCHLLYRRTQHPLASDRERSPVSDF